MGQIKSPVII